MNLRMIARHSASALAGLLLAGCNTTTPSGAPLLPRPDRVYLFITPKELRDETTYPPGQTTQLLQWEGKEFHWVITFPRHHHGYAGLQFKYHVDLAPVMSHGDLTFTVSPASAATNLAVALLDGTNQAPRVMVTLPLRGTSALFNDGVSVVRVPLRSFPALGIPLDETGQSFTDAPFDPSDLREIRFVSPQGLHGGPVTISHLRVEH